LKATATGAAGFRRHGMARPSVHAHPAPASLVNEVAEPSALLPAGTEV